MADLVINRCRLGFFGCCARSDERPQRVARSFRTEEWSDYRIVLVIDAIAFVMLARFSGLG